ncbi:TetR family transcriptional regulator [Corynebacterium striatum]|uniref:TetR family transcriptional regulator n=1 Tax=Corynebacterium striatum TaxID=43770 RepID=UPI001FC8B2AD|nr:TetR family transcriptional regulator [Corynebacterium striatum]GKH17488.1 TetR family transcriptional regulator [Corynebacterium striatum]
MQLHRDRILFTALELLNSYGLADVTMRRVSTTLGVAPGALYWHVANKQALIAGMAEEILSPVEGSNPVDFAMNLHDTLISWRDGAEVASAGLAFPDSHAWDTLIDKLSASFDSISDQTVSDDSIHAAALAIAHLVLGATQMEQSQQQLLATAGEGQTIDHVPDIRRGVEIIVKGLRAPF